LTLVEVLVAATIVGLAVTSLLSALGATSQGEARLIEKEEINRIAESKLRELVTTGEWQFTLSGEFEDPTLSEYSWELETEPTGTENLELLSLVVAKEGTDLDETLTQLVYTPPEVIEEEGQNAPQ
jgi:type II secretion system protein I